MPGPHQDGTGTVCPGSEPNRSFERTDPLDPDNIARRQGLKHVDSPEGNTIENHDRLLAAPPSSEEERPEPVDRLIGSMCLDGAKLGSLDSVPLERLRRDWSTDP